MAVDMVVEVVTNGRLETALLPTDRSPLEDIALRVVAGPPHGRHHHQQHQWIRIPGVCRICREVRLQVKFQASTLGALVITPRALTQRRVVK